ncbi:MAG: hypothetical protein JJ896_07500 [Rhodothermales bacterium]|nr:hypothetical protein [Rhodothermales bacterium]MBO6779483.1 hypothetical protein [Rhodothermales bacterium]
MLASTNYHIKSTSATRAVFIWLLTCCSVFYVMDGVATRDVPIHVEDFRTPGMSDEQALSLAVQAAHASEPNYWWIHDKRPYLVFDPARDYSVTPQLFEVFDLEMVSSSQTGPIGLLRPRMASMK